MIFFDFSAKNDSESEYEGDATVLQFNRNKTVVGRICPECKYSVTQKSVAVSKKNLDCPNCKLAKISDFYLILSIRMIE